MALPALHAYHVPGKNTVVANVGKAIAVAFVILSALASVGGFLLLDKKIHDGESRIARGCMRIDRGKAKLETGKDRLEKGMQEMEDGRKEYEQAMDDKSLVLADKLLNDGKGFREAREKIAVGPKRSPMDRTRSRPMKRASMKASWRSAQGRNCCGCPGLHALPVRSERPYLSPCPYCSDSDGGDHWHGYSSPAGRPDTQDTNHGRHPVARKWNSDTLE